MTSDQKRWIGKRLGAYEIVALIGSGGMGEVYRARRIDAQYEKEVAIKLVPWAGPAGFILEQLRSERQILATLDHPNIAQLIDGGATEDGHPYLVLDLVEGVPLDRHCEERSLSVRKRLQLFRDVCSAVSYAHQKLVVHRDLKPANILVTAGGTVKLLDFGIAKLLQPVVGQAGAAQTVTGLNTLTLEFASPEQLLGKTITTGTDVYSLGVILYLLLTRQMPYATHPTSLHESIRAVCETEPVRPSAAVLPANRRPREKLDADLDAITLRALRKEPERRYRSVEEFSEDVRRYLDAMPVMARGGQFTYRAGKFMRRRRLEIGAAALFLAMLVGGIVASTEQARIADQQRARAQRHVETVRGFAELSMFQLHDAIKDLAGSTSARQLLVNTAQEYLKALASEAREDSRLRHDIAVAYAKVADIQGKVYAANTGQPAAAAENYAKAIELLEPLVAAHPDDLSQRNSLAQSYLQQSRLLLMLGDSKKAVASSRRAMEIYESLAKADPSADARAWVADSLRVHAMNLTIDGSAKAAVPLTRRGIEMLEQIHRENPDDLGLEYRLSVAYGTAGALVGGDGVGDDPKRRALELTLKSLAIDEHLVAATEGQNVTYVRAVLTDRVNLCSLLNDAREYSRAIEHCRAAQPLMKDLLTDDKNAQGLVDSASLSWNLGSALLGAGRIAEAQKVFEQNERALREMSRENDTLQVQYLRAASEAGLGEIQARLAGTGSSGKDDRLRRWRKAKEWYELAVPRFEDVAGRLALEAPDRAPIERAKLGLSRSRGEVEKLEGRPAPR